MHHFSHSLCEKKSISAFCIEPTHIPYISCRKPTHIGKLGTQVGGKLLHNGITPTGCLLLLNNAASNIPIEQDQLAVDRVGG